MKWYYLVGITTTAIRTSGTVANASDQLNEKKT